MSLVCETRFQQKREVSLRFVLNSRNPDSAAALVCINGLYNELTALGHTCEINNWTDYSRFDVAIFMAADAQPEFVKSINPKILVGVADPKPSTIKQARLADFCLVSSLEQYEVFLKYNRNLFVYYMIPEFDFKPVTHKVKTLHKIFYHGNKVHLNSSFEGLVPALNELGKKHQIELNVIYNKSELGKWRIGRPEQKYCPVNDLQWYPNCYVEYLKNADIGVVQNFLPWRRKNLIRRLGLVSKSVLLEGHLDHMYKFKSSTNAGRAFVFGYFNIPVVAEAVPSLCEAIKDRHSGRLVLSPEGWYDALDELISSSALRAQYSAAFRTEIQKRFSAEVSAKRLVQYLSDFQKKTVVTPKSVEVNFRTERLRHLIHKSRRWTRHINQR